MLSITLSPVSFHSTSPTFTYRFSPYLMHCSRWISGMLKTHGAHSVRIENGDCPNEDPVTSLMLLALPDRNFCTLNSMHVLPNWNRRSALALPPFLLSASLLFSLFKLALSWYSANFGKKLKFHQLWGMKLGDHSANSFFLMQITLLGSGSGLTRKSDTGMKRDRYQICAPDLDK